ncbi:MAG: DUF547 domain-containing protein [Thermodesulfobacteriota bacterium]
MAESAFDHNYGDYTALLNKNVNNGKVDYKGIKSSNEDLNAVVSSFSAVTKEQYNGWSESQKLAFLINVYNAETLKLVAENYPLKSIKDIGDPWDMKVVNLFGSKISLNQLEHEIIRKNFKEPRIHFALVCAAKGCPVLTSEAYTADRLESQLEGSTSAFLQIEEKNSIDDNKKIIMISPIFDWFKEDFNNRSGSVVAFISPYYSKNPENLKNYQIKYTFYDWSLNDKS